MKRALSYKQEKYCSKKICRIKRNYLETTLLLLPNELLKIILSFCGIVEHHVLRLVCKHIHKLVHGYNVLLTENTNNKRYFFKRKKYDIILSVMKEIDINVLIWMKELFPGIFLPNFASYCKCAAKFGRLDILKWARENNCPWNKDTCSEAALFGHLEVLKWIRKNGCPWDTDTCSSAARRGHSEILKWARENGCPWNEETCTVAAKTGHFEALRAALARNIKMGNRKWM
jgi:hypothetical protein